MKHETLKMILHGLVGGTIGLCLGILLGVASQLSLNKGYSCNHAGSICDVTFARTSTGTLIAWSNGLEHDWKHTYWPRESEYTRACEVFEPYMAYATLLSHNRGRQVTFCEKCWPYEEDIQCDIL